MPSQYCSSLSLFPQNRSEFNLSVTKLRDQSGARSDNGMGAGEPGWNTSNVQRISGRKRNIHRALFLKIFSKVADNRENKLTNKSFSDYLICLIILKKSESFSWRETLSVWYPKRRKKMRENMRMSEGFWTDNKTLILDWAGVIITKRFLNLSSWPYSESPCIIKISYHCLSGLRTARLILDAFKIKSIT